MRLSSISRAVLTMAIAGSIGGCAALQQYAALTRVAFSLDAVGDGRLAGVPLARIASFRDLSTADAARLVATLGRGTAPLEFTVDVGASNPASNHTDARLTHLDWLLLLDGKETVRGAIDSSYLLPAGEPVTIPVRVQLDLRQFFSGNLEEIVNLAAVFAGASKDPTRVTLELTPHIDTPLGSLTPPQPIRVSGTAGRSSG